MNYTKRMKVIILIASLAAGAVNGLIGTGGGIILYFTLKLSQKFNSGEKNPDSIKDIMANIIAVVVPMSVVSAIIYALRGDLAYGELVTYLPPAIIGGLVGAFLLNKLKSKVVKKIFAVMIIYAGARMMMG